MEKEITKTNKITIGKLKSFDTITFDFGKKDISMGMTFNTNTFTGNCSFAKSLEGVTIQQGNVIKKYFKRVERICLNNGVNPDIPIIDDDIEEME